MTDSAHHVSTFPDAAQSLGDKLASLELTGAEAAALGDLIRRADAVLRPDVDPVVDTALIPAAAQRGVIGRTARSLRIGVGEARSAFEDALSLLQAQIDSPDLRLSPSAKVDEAWHQFVLFTIDYARYCDALRAFVHHVPAVDEPAEPVKGPHMLSTSETYTFLRERGYRVHDELWRSPTVADAIAQLQHA